MIRKVYSRDGTLLEEWKNLSSKVTNEYVALTMVDMMRGVVSGGGTAPGASAGGQPLAGKTGTVNDHTDVWFIGYTPTYVTGVWMGNPERKENLGSYMTGGHGALPFFNAFMDPFMKGKPRETFPGVPPMPADIRRQMEINKREELEKLEKAEQAAIKSGAALDTNSSVSVGAPADGGSTTTEPDRIPDAPKSNPSDDKPTQTKPVITQPPPRNPEAPAGGENPEGKKRKGKKGDG
jgi:penicillin-binding protein 1A